MSEERLPGAASPAGTRRGAESFGAGARTLGRTGLHVSPIGFGGYRVSDSSPVHRRALADALRGGINLIDTSTNYTGGSSERLVGRIVSNLVQQGELRREQLVVVSKVGYVQGENLQRVQQRSEPYAEVVQYAEHLWHCIHPDFIEDQLSESLDRLALSQLDVLLLHNPEYFLLDAARRGVDPVAARDHFDARIKAAFGACERAVADGRIAWYGVSSNGFVVDGAAPERTSIARMVELAREVAGDAHHFAVVQMPMNLFEQGALTAAADGKSPLDIASAHDLGVLVNRPLNALSNIGGVERLVRLAARGEAADGTGDLDAPLARLRKLEAQWATGLGQQLVTEAGDDAGDLFRWGRELSARVDGIGSIEQWRRLRHEVIAPHLGKTSSALLAALTGEAKERFAQWWEAYGKALHDSFAAIEARVGAKTAALVDDISARLNPLVPAPWRELPLSDKAVLSLLGTPVACVLVGMRRPGYVADMLTLRDTPMRVLSAAAGAVDLRAVGAKLAELA